MVKVRNIENVLNTPESHFKIIKMVNFKFYVFHNSKKKKKSYQGALV